MRKIALANHKDSIGKSTIAINGAAGLALLGKEILLKELLA